MTTKPVAIFKCPDKGQSEANPLSNNSSPTWELVEMQT